MIRNRARFSPPPLKLRWASAAMIGLAGLLLGIIATDLLRAADAGAQSANARRVIRPEKAPNTGLPFSPGIQVGDTLYVSGHLGRDPVTSKLVAGGIEAETQIGRAHV